MPALEYIVRPFQLPSVSLPEVVESELSLVGTIEGAFTSDGGGVMFSWSYNASTSHTPGADYRETDRKSKTVRVENENDPNQWVDVRRPYEITVQNEIDEEDKLTWKLKSDVSEL